MVEGSDAAVEAADRLWSLLDRTRPPVIDPRAHADALAGELERAGVAATVEVARTFARAMAELNTWDLWAGGYVLLLGCGDDAFEYLRAWIIGRGWDAFDQARRDPEGYIVGLVAGTDHDESLVAERIEDLAVLDGEPLLYAAGTAHERLTGAWLPSEPADADRPTEPTGEPWEEDEVGRRVPRLVAALPDGWLEAGTEPVDLAEARFATAAGTRSLDELVQEAMSADVAFDTARRVREGIEAHESGDSRLAADLLGPVVRDPVRWAEVPASGFAAADVAYVAGISLHHGGDVDGAAAALRLGMAGSLDDRIRRALAQVELARGELAAADRLLDASPKAALMDQGLMVTLRWRQGRLAEADERASNLVHAKPRRQLRGQHPWNVAGALVQAGFVLAERGDLSTLILAMERVSELVRDAPAELPLRGQLGLLLASARRLEGRFTEAADALTATAPFLDPDTCDMGLYEQERARLCRAQGDETGAATRYAQAVATFEGAGERWHAAQARAEADRTSPPRFS